MQYNISDLFNSICFCQVFSWLYVNNFFDIILEENVMISLYSLVKLQSLQ